MNPKERSVNAARRIDIKRMLAGRVVSEKGMAVEIEQEIEEAVKAERARVQKAIEMDLPEAAELALAAVENVSQALRAAIAKADPHYSDEEKTL